MKTFTRRSLLGDAGRLTASLAVGDILLSDLISARGETPKNLGSTAVKDGETIFTTTTGATWRWTNKGLTFPKGHSGFGGDTHAPITADGKLYVGNYGPEGVSVFDMKTRAWIPKDNFLFAKLNLSGTHGLTAGTDGKETHLWITTNSGATPGRLIKTTLTGEKIWEIGKPEGHQGAWNPTEFTCVSNGEGVLTNGYGSGYMYLIGADGKVKKTLFKPGKELGELNGCHGVLWDHEPGLLWAFDRGNRRIVFSDLDGKPSGQLKDSGQNDTLLRMPCGGSAWKNYLVMPDLEGRITFFERTKNGKLPGGYEVTGLFGDNGIRSKDFGKFRSSKPEDVFKNGCFGTPHYASFDPTGNVILAEWHPKGRVIILERMT